MTQRNAYMRFMRAGLNKNRMPMELSSRFKDTTREP